MRPVALAGFSGGLAGTFLQLLREATGPAASPIEYLAPAISEVCSCTDSAWKGWVLDIDPRSLVVGICLGLALGPVLECICLVRQLWAVYLRAQVAGWRPARSSYRVLG